jgi:hypothetical protein
MIMNPWILSDLADSRVREMRRQAAECRTAECRTAGRRTRPRPARGVNRRLQLRHRLGFGLVEAGLRVLATTRPAP